VGTRVKEKEGKNLWLIKDFIKWKINDFCWVMWYGRGIQKKDKGDGVLYKYTHRPRLGRSSNT